MLWQRQAGRYCSSRCCLCFGIAGSYECRCPLGFEKSPGGDGCQDVDECLLAQKTFSLVPQHQQQLQTQKQLLQQQKLRVIANARQRQGGKLLPGAPAVCDHNCTNTPGGYECRCVCVLWSCLDT